MLGAAGATVAAGYAATAFTYNRDRFHFNAKQRQHRIHQNQSMKLELWKLFREDVRDLFELTTSNMNTYMVVGSLLVTCIIGFIFVGYQEFPMEPPWLLLIWNNSVFSAITFGILSVWLATHGSSSSNSAATKILTQAVRPPVPGLTEVRNAMRLQEQYEKSGVKNFLMPPAFVPGAKLGGLQEMDAPGKSSETTKETPKRLLDKENKEKLPERESRRKYWEKSQAADLNKEIEAEAAAWLEEGAHATDDIGQLLATADGGPGKSAAQYNHFWMLRKVQRGYACFDAYARISLTVSAQQLLLVGAYYAIALFMTKTEGWPEPAQNPATGWLSSATAAFAGCILYKLDLFVVKRQRRLVDLAIFLGPLMLTLAVHLAVIRDNNGRMGLRACDQAIPAWAPWTLALVSCALHMGWIIIILKVSCPLKSRGAGLPMSYRSSIYLDVFGWHSKRFRRANASGMPKAVTVQATPFMSKDRCAAAAFKEAKRISKVLQKFGAPEITSHLSPEEAEDLHKMQVILEEDVKELEDHLNLPEYEPDEDAILSNDDGSWLQCYMEDGKGHASLYWVDAHTGCAILCLTSLGFVGLPTVLGSSAKDTPYQQPEQIHIALGQPGEVTVHWSSIQESYLRQKSGYHPGESYVIYGESIDDLTRTVIGSSFLFQDYGPERRKFTMHMAAMKGLTANTKYCYMVGGNRTGWSAPMYFTSPPVTDHDVKVRLPMTYAIYGDQGDYNAQTLPSLQQAAARGELDMVLHVGDMAYDFHSDNGRNGDAWMRDIEPLAAYVPYMVSHGNHESAQNFNHYTQRFRNMPSNSGTLTFPEFGTVPNNWWYSWDDGLVHFVAISTEVYFDYHDMVPEQYRWLEKDLAAVNRSKTPWVVVHGHRPLYCSCDEDCDAPATTNRMGLQLPDGTFKYGLEQLFYQHGVDFYIAGHEHDYERMYDVAPGYDAATPWLSGATTRSTVDPPATTYIVTGSAGNIEDHESFSRPAPSRSAKRLNTYGWSKMTVYNASHILWQQIQTDTAAPSSTWGQVMDEAWIVQQHHGPFADHPRRSEIEKVGLAGLPALADPEVSLDVAMKYAARRLKNEAQCKHMPAGQEPRCTDPRLAQDLAQQGRWQYTKRRADGDGVQLV